MERTSYIPVPREPTVMNVMGVHGLYQSLTNNNINPIDPRDSSLNVNILIENDDIIKDEIANLNPHASNNHTVAHVHTKGTHPVSHNPTSLLTNTNRVIHSSASKSKGIHTTIRHTIRGSV